MSAPILSCVSSRISYNSNVLYKFRTLWRIRHNNKTVNCFNTNSSDTADVSEHSESCRFEVENDSENTKSDFLNNSKGNSGSSKKGRRRKKSIKTSEFLSEKYNIRHNSEESEKVVIAPYGVIRMDSHNRSTGKTKWLSDKTKPDHISGYVDVDQTLPDDYYGIQKYEINVKGNDYWDIDKAEAFEEHADQPKPSNQLIGPDGTISTARITAGTEENQCDMKQAQICNQNASNTGAQNHPKGDFDLNYFDETLIQDPSVLNTDLASKSQQMTPLSSVENNVVDKEQLNYFDQLLIPEGLEQLENFTPEEKDLKAENCKEQESDLNYFDELLVPDKRVLNEEKTCDIEAINHKYNLNKLNLHVHKEKESAVYETDYKHDPNDGLDKTTTSKTKNIYPETTQKISHSDITRDNASSEDDVCYDEFINVPTKKPEKSSAFEAALKIRHQLKNARSVEARRLKEEVEHDIGTKEGTKASFSGRVDSKGFRLLTNQVPDFSNTPIAMIAAILHKNILYEDDNLLVLDKPYGLSCKASRQGPSVEEALPKLSRLCHLKSTETSLQLAHTQDTTSTGIIILAKNQEALDYLKSLKHGGEIVRKYWLLTKGVPSPSEGIIDIPMKKVEIDGAYRMALQPERTDQTIPLVQKSRGEIHRAVTSYRVLDSNREAALVECQPETDVLHQIRCHMAFGLNTPILGDHRYSHISRIAPQRLYGDTLQSLGIRQAKVRHLALHLHATTVVLPHFLGEKNIFIRSMLPKHFITNMKRLKITPKGRK